MRSAMEWAQVRAMAADGISQREIASRLGINRRTVRRLAVAETQPVYERAASGSMLDPLVSVIGGLLAEWPAIKAPRVTEILRDDYGYAGSKPAGGERSSLTRPALRSTCARRPGRTFRGTRNATPSNHPNAP